MLLKAAGTLLLIKSEFWRRAKCLASLIPLFSHTSYHTLALPDNLPRIQWNSILMFLFLSILYQFIWTQTMSMYFLFAIQDLLSILHLSGCRESDLCGLYQWAVLLFGFSLALVNWRAEESVYVFHPALSLLWIKAGCTPLLLGSSKIVLGISVTVSSPYPLRPKDNRNFLCD